MALRQFSLANFEGGAVVAHVEFDDASSPARAIRFYATNNGSGTLRIAAKRPADSEWFTFDFDPGDTTSRNLPTTGPNRLFLEWTSVDAQGVPIKPHWVNLDVSVQYPYFGN